MLSGRSVSRVQRALLLGQVVFDDESPTQLAVHCRCFRWDEIVCVDPMRSLCCIEQDLTLLSAASKVTTVQPRRQEPC